MNSLELNYYYHDTTASIVSDGQLIVAIEEERLTRDKHTWQFPVQSASKLMEVAGLKPKDIDHVAISIKPSLNMCTRLLYGLKNFTNARPFIKHKLVSGRKKQPVLLNTSFNIMGEPIVESPSHAIRCFFTTGLDVLVLGNYVIKK